jgi:SAM-dependent methyltransferase
MGVMLVIATLVAALAVHLYHLNFASRPTRTPTADDQGASARRNAFDNVYTHKVWGTDSQGRGTSGLGSSLETTKLYRAFLQDLLATNKIRSVVDAGCGDWEFSQQIDWTGIDYVGLDIVESVIKADQARFGAPNIRFAVADIVRDELPAADLLVVKDVLQHLPNADIQRFLAKLAPYRHVLLINDVDPATLTAPNVDIAPGGYRILDPTAPPHNLVGTKVLLFRSAHNSKLVVHLQRPDR